ncbi:DUF2127 domain-containing protein [Cupriavidus basilensis]
MRRRAGRGDRCPPAPESGQPLSDHLPVTDVRSDQRQALAIAAPLATYFLGNALSPRPTLRRQRAWAKWLGVWSGAIYIPVELYASGGSPPARYISGWPLPMC